MSSGFEELNNSLSHFKDWNEIAANYAAEDLSSFLSMLHCSLELQPEWVNNPVKAAIILNNKMSEVLITASNYYQLNGDMDDLREEFSGSLHDLGGLILRTLIHINNYDLNI